MFGYSTSVADPTSLTSDIFDTFKSKLELNPFEIFAAMVVCHKHKR
jgi:hypothetical protein